MRILSTLDNDDVSCDCVSLNGCSVDGIEMSSSSNTDSVSSFKNMKKMMMIMMMMMKIMVMMK